MESTKKCTKCGRILPLSEFYKRKNGRVYSACKECTKAVSNNYNHRMRAAAKSPEEQYAKNMAMVAEIMDKQEKEKKEEQKESARKLPIQIVQIPESAKHHTKETGKESKVEKPASPVTGELKPLDIPPMPEDFTPETEPKKRNGRKTLASAEPVELMMELADRGYFGFIHYIEHKKETIEHNGHNGIFEYDDEHIIDITKLK